jgi:integrin beta 8
MSDLFLTSFAVPDLVVDVIGGVAEVNTVAPQGPPGPTGPTGAAGNTILSGNGTPLDELGRDGDFYLDRTSSILYGPKANGAWPSSGAGLIGPAGADGAPGEDGKTILSGAGAPQNTDGTDGDFYLDTQDHVLYGPKASTWPAGVSLVGTDGADGADGVDGAPGADGKTLLSGSGAPSGGTGINGDFYLDTTSHVIYGPKVSGSWPAGVALVGP